MIITNPSHYHQNGRGEYNGRDIVPAFECPARYDAIMAALETLDFGPVLVPENLWDIGPAAKLHDPALIKFLTNGYDRWRALHDGMDDDQIGDAVPGTMPAATMARREPTRIDGALGFWCYDACTPLQPGTWQAASGSAATAIAGANHLIKNKEIVFSLCRPPGHHAGRAYYGGFCFLNNAAIAVQQLRDQGMGRVALLDVDYHHGNGSQDIFWDRDDVLFVSLHADPALDYPFFAGFADETGHGAGLGSNLNIPLPFGTDWAAYAPMLEKALTAIQKFKPDALVISFGADTYNLDPIGKFNFQTPDFWAMGRLIAGLDLPMQVVMEGGYAISALGQNVRHFLGGLKNIS